MNHLNIDITALDTAQLEVLKGIAPEAVAAELQRRQSYESLPEAISHLLQRGADLKARFEALKNSPAAKEVKASGVLEAFTRFENFASLNGMEFTKPEAVSYVKPELKSVELVPVLAEDGVTPVVDEATGEPVMAPKPRKGKGKKAEEAPAAAEVAPVEGETVTA